MLVVLLDAVPVRRDPKKPFDEPGMLPNKPSPSHRLPFRLDPSVRSHHIARIPPATPAITNMLARHIIILNAPQLPRGWAERKETSLSSTHPTLNVKVTGSPRTILLPFPAAQGSRGTLNVLSSFPSLSRLATSGNEYADPATTWPFMWYLEGFAPFDCMLVDRWKRTFISVHMCKWLYWSVPCTAKVMGVNGVEESSSPLSASSLSLFLLFFFLCFSFSLMSSFLELNLVLVPSKGAVGMRHARGTSEWT